MCVAGQLSSLCVTGREISSALPPRGSAPGCGVQAEVSRRGVLLEGCSCSMVGLTSSSSASYGWVRSAFSGWGRAGKEKAGCAVVHRNQM